MLELESSEKKKILQQLIKGSVVHPAPRDVRRYGLWYEIAVDIGANGTVRVAFPEDVYLHLLSNTD